jgi:hypothetical protein
VCLVSPICRTRYIVAAMAVLCGYSHHGVEALEVDNALGIEVLAEDATARHQPAAWLAKSCIKSTYVLKSEG